MKRIMVYLANMASLKCALKVSHLRGSDGCLSQKEEYKCCLLTAYTIRIEFEFFGVKGRLLILHCLLKDQNEFFTFASYFGKQGND